MWPTAFSSPFIVLPLVLFYNNYFRGSKISSYIQLVSGFGNRVL